MRENYTTKYGHQAQMDPEHSLAILPFSSDLYKTNISNALNCFGLWLSILSYIKEPTFIEKHRYYQTWRSNGKLRRLMTALAGVSNG